MTAGYVVNFCDANGEIKASKRFAIKHFRQYEGKEVSPLGGFTLLIDLDTARSYVAKCRPDESFSRRKGILTCLQKALNHGMLREITAECGQVIENAEFGKDGVDLYIGDTGANQFYFL